MWTCNRLDLGTQGSRPTMPENLPGHWHISHLFDDLQILWMGAACCVIETGYPRFFFFFFLRQKADRPTPKHIRQLTTWQVFCQVERRFHNRESNRQPLPWDLGISPPSSSSLGSSRTSYPRKLNGEFKVPNNDPSLYEEKKKKKWNPDVAISTFTNQGLSHLFVCLINYYSCQHKIAKEAPQYHNII